MAAKPPLLELRSQLGSSQDSLLLLESQMPPAISDGEDTLRECVLVRFQCRLLLGLLI